MLLIKFVCIQILVFRLLRYWSSIGRRRSGRRTWQNYFKYYMDFSRFLRFFFNIISFRHVLHFGVGRSQIDWNVKVKGQILICTAIMLNDHSNPYIESTTVLSDRQTDRQTGGALNSQGGARPRSPQL